jgi:alkanesulfonate monooxygenase SsuD/methylene tetrahydromethanopterin reductase-like flavin-dependent oxidoreductase (luciferase family)
VQLDIQINIGQCSWQQTLDAALAAESAGYGAFWVVDHLSGAVMGAPTMPECFTTLGALASSTTQIELGSLVVNSGLRNPALVANSAATVQNISAGRFILGLGAGASPTSSFAAELHAVGSDIGESMAIRHDRLEHALDVLDEMWSPSRGEQFATFPLPQVRVPRWLGVNSVALGAVAGKRCDGVNVRASHPHRAQILRAAQNEAAEWPFALTVWETFDESLLDESNAIRKQWASEGVNRIILLMRGVPNVARIAARKVK